MDSALQISNAIIAGADAYIRSESILGNGTELVSVVDLQDGNCYIKKQGITKPNLEYPQEEDKLVKMETDLRPTFQDLVKMGYQEFSQGDHDQNKALLINSPNLTDIISGYEVKNIEMKMSTSQQQIHPFGFEGDNNLKDFEHYNNGERFNQIPLLYENDDANAGDYYYLENESIDEKPPLGEFSGQIDKASKKSSLYGEAVGQVDSLNINGSSQQVISYKERKPKIKKPKMRDNSQQIVIRSAESQQMVLTQEPGSSFKDESSQRVISSPKIGVSSVSSKTTQLDESSNCSSEEKETSSCSSSSGNLEQVIINRKSPVQVPSQDESSEECDSDNQEEVYISASDDVSGQLIVHDKLEVKHDNAHFKQEKAQPQEDSICSSELIDDGKKHSSQEITFEVERGTNAMAPMTSEDSLPDVVHDKSVQGESLLTPSSSEKNSRNMRDHDSQELIAEVSNTSQNLILFNNTSPRTYHVNQLRKISRHQPKEYRFKIAKK